MENLELTNRSAEVYNLIKETVGVSDFHIAGGIMRKTVENPSINAKNMLLIVSDVDVFVSSGETYQTILGNLMKAGYTVAKQRGKSVLMAGDVLSGKPDIDLVLLGNGTGQSIIDTFDFTNSCAAFGPDGLTTHPTFLTDVLNKELRLNKVKMPFHTIQRAGKFIKEGYTIDLRVKLELFDNAVNATRTLEEEKSYMETL